MYKITILFLAFFYVFTLNAQQIENEVSLETSENIQSILAKTSLSEVLKNAGNSDGFLDITDVNDGFVIKYFFKKKYYISYYDYDLNTIWTKVIKQKYGILPRQKPKSIMTTFSSRNVKINNPKSIHSNSKNIFFVQADPTNNKLFVSLIPKSKQGKIINKDITTTTNYDRYITCLANEEKLFILTYNNYYQMKKMQYHLYSFSSKDLGMEIKEVKLPKMTGNERIKFFGGSQGPYIHPEFIWQPLTSMNGKTVLYKMYFDKRKDNKNIIHYKIKTTEFNPQTGKCTNTKTFAFNNIAVDCLPTGNCIYHSNSINLFLDTKNKHLYFMGGRSIRDKQFIDEVFILKRDYLTKDTLFDKKFILNQLAKEIKPAKKFTGDIDKSSIYFDPVNKTIVYNLMNSWNNTTKTMEAIFFDSTCDIYKIQQEEYIYYPIHDGFFLLPNKKETIYKKHQNKSFTSHQASSLDFINSFMDKNNPDNILWSVIDKNGFSIIVSIKANNGEIKGYKIKHGK